MTDPAVRRDLLGLPLDGLTMAQAVDRCTSAVERGDYLPVGMINAAKAVTMLQDERLRDAVTSCGMVLADGQSVVWASRLLGSPLPERVAGVDLFGRLLAVAARRGLRVYFLGAEESVLALALAKVRRAFPGLVVAGARDGYYPADQDEDVAAEIRESGADILFVGMTSPRKELFISQWGPLTGVKVAHGVGGSSGALAGVTRRAPLWPQSCALEGLSRAAQEPARLGRQYMSANASFITMVTRELIRQRMLARAESARRPSAQPSPPPASRAGAGARPGARHE
jgi:N-acetylglucosaminyldiphosphoundecaprenol N-acetyl-beta-D-mannosaminyltransferase